MFRELKGVLTGAVSQNDFQTIVHWYLRNHVEDTIGAIRAHCDKVEIIGPIVQVLAKLACRKKTDFEAASAEGIELFKASLSAIQVIMECCTFDDREWQAVKIMCPSFNGRYANFGIMAHFGDDSFDRMCEIFFGILANWATGETEKHVVRVISCLCGINQITPSAILLNEKRFCDTSEFLIECLLAKSAVLWKAACSCLWEVMKSAAELNVSLSRFMQHFIVIMDGLINMPFGEKELREATGRCVFALKKWEGDLVEKVLLAIIDAFEGRYREQVRELMSFLGGSYENSECTTGFQAEIEKFQIEIQKYSVELANIEGFAPIFRRQI
jgi:hypothetical protein